MNNLSAASINNFKATIIGGGIGGLTMANALQQVGFDYELYEQAPELTEVGAGIGLTNSTLSLLDRLELGDQVREKGTRIESVYLADKNLNVRRKIPAASPGVCIHRAYLIDILKSRLPQDKIHLSKKVTGVESSPDHTKITFSDGEVINSVCTIAADGIHSVIRKALFPEIDVRYINQAIWRGITEMEIPEIMQDSFIEIWDEQLRFLTVPFTNGKTFWLAVKPQPPGINETDKDAKKMLLELFKNFHPGIRDLIRNSGNIIKNDMNDLGSPVRPWHHNRVVFIGDSIHATTPNLAQGGCQAIEDAVCLSLCLKAGFPDLQNVYQKYQQLRLKKVKQIVNTSWTFGVAAHSRNPFKYYPFLYLLQFAPAAFISKQEKFLNDLSWLNKI